MDKQFFIAFHSTLLKVSLFHHYFGGILDVKVEKINRKVVLFYFNCSTIPRVKLNDLGISRVIKKYKSVAIREIAISGGKRWLSVNTYKSIEKMF